MIALIQRVSRAGVTVEGSEVARIGGGMLALVGVEASDSPGNARALVKKLLTFRMFADEAGKMNRNLRQVNGELLLVPQFTLVADTHQGNRPGFSRGAPVARARDLFSQTVLMAAEQLPGVASGVFGAHMQVELVNDGPVTFWIKA